MAAPKAQTAQRRVAPTRTGAARLQVVEMPRRRYPVVAVMSVPISSAARSGCSAYGRCTAPHTKGM